MDGVLSPQQLMRFQEPAPASQDGGPHRQLVQCPPLQSPAAPPLGFGQRAGDAGFYQQLLEDKVSILIDHQRPSAVTAKH